MMIRIKDVIAELQKLDPDGVVRSIEVSKQYNIEQFSENKVVRLPGCTLIVSKLKNHTPV